MNLIIFDRETGKKTTDGEIIQIAISFSGYRDFLNYEDILCDSMGEDEFFNWADETELNKMTDFNKAKNLNELVSMLNDATEIGEGVLCELPTFGGDEPEGEIMLDCFSWDETHYLQQNTCTGDSFHLVERYWATPKERQAALRKRRADDGMKELRNVWVTHDQEKILRAKIKEWLKDLSI